MNQAIKRTWMVVVLLFLVLLAAASYIQVIGAEDLKSNDANSRQIYQQFGSARGPILVDGEPIAESVPADSENFDYQRVYNSPEMYSALTGFYSLHYGSTGLESKLNEELDGTSDDMFADRMAKMFSGSAMEGAQVELTIDSEIQQLAFDAIPEDTSGIAVVTEPDTGKIVAMASRPTYDTNTLAVHSGAEAKENMDKLTADGISPYQNNAAERTISPGSTFKLIDTIAMLESGDYSADSELEIPDSITLPQTDDLQLGNFHGGTCGERDEEELSWIFAQSCNTPFAEAAMDMGQEPIQDVAEKFGFNEGMEMPLKVEASKFPEDDLADATLAQSSLGQADVQATALQMNMVAAGIANGGTVMQPQLVEEVRGSDLTLLQDFSAEEYSQATSEEIADEVTQMMIGTMESGTGYAGHSDQFDIAAKTGTAQISAEDDNVHSWITGFAPAEDPQYAVTLVYPNIDYDRGHTLTSQNMKNIMEAVVEQ